ncbi:MAG TPA: thioredoxin domain-containing protein [Verrucomicrobiales bacterium]|nr:thioredoxin domain-containing protein [Verrucomicrobiales bacterium]
MNLNSKLKLKQQGLRWSAAAALMGVALISGGCGKPATARREFNNATVRGETGALPPPGTANRLLNEQSAFLRRHAKDPIDWHPWGAEAFEKAKKRGKPVMVSIGYASCPWSQKMHSESFSDPEIARFMNAHFVCILVDREERPDVNTAFLHFAFWKQKISGWPLHVWLTPEGLPIYQGVYFPPVSKGAEPSWSLTIEHVANNWETTTEYVRDQAKKVADGYLKDFRSRWLGPPPEGSPEVRGVKEFMKLPLAKQLADLTAMSDDKLNYAIVDLPTVKIEELWGQMSPAVATETVGRLNSLSAATLFAKLQGPAREPAFQRFVQESRNLNFQKLRSLYDPVYGGFGPPPRFAPHQSLDFLLRFSQRENADRNGRMQHEAMAMVTSTLDHMLAGGMFDQIGGGFHRYSTDIYWSVPQFEKMLYDQGYMAQILVSAAQLSGRRDYLNAAAGLLAYTGRELSHPEGAFYCAEGSSSPTKEGGMTEGAFYVWSKKELDEVTGASAPLVNAVFGIDERGNLPLDSSMRDRLGKTNILMIVRKPEDVAKDLGKDPAEARKEFTEACAKLLEARRKRPRPTLEDKVLTSWNGVAISGFARTGFALKDDALVQRGAKAAEFILTKMRSKDGGLLHAFLDGPSPLPGYSEDYATLITALLDLYEATGTVRWLSTAMELQARQVTDLWDKTDGGFFDGPDSPYLFHRMKSMDEASEISAGSSSLLNLVTLSKTLNLSDYRDKARRIVERYGAQAAMIPGAFVRFLRATDSLADPEMQLVISGAPTEAARNEMVDVLRMTFRPGIPLLYMDGAESEKLLLSKVPDLAPLSAQPGKASVHLCRGFKPEKSFTSAKELSAELNKLYALPAEGAGDPKSSAINTGAR